MFAEPPWCESWSREEVQEDLDYAIQANQACILIAERESELVGFTWGYELPLDKFPFLVGKTGPQPIYMDEIAVKNSQRGKNIGTLLGQFFLLNFSLQQASDVILRTDERNKASMALFEKLGFKPLGVYDPEFEERLYLQRRLR